jgi:hypothetical protein
MTREVSIAHTGYRGALAHQPRTFLKHQVLGKPEARQEYCNQYNPDPYKNELVRVGETPTPTIHLTWLPAIVISGGQRGPGLR